MLRIASPMRREEIKLISEVQKYETLGDQKQIFPKR
jgi:hypothetical protein